MENSALPSFSRPMPVKRRGNPAWLIRNPGRGRPYAVFQDPRRRVKTLMAKYTMTQILNFSADIKDAPLSLGDAILVVQIANALKGDGRERERFFNRYFGKVPSRVSNAATNAHVSAESLSKRAAELLARLSG